jgi:hypothetical protein
MHRVVGCLAACLILLGSASAQWITIKLPRTPRTADGKPDLNGPVPRAADGKPDLSGIWTRVAPPKRTSNTDNFDLLDWMPAGSTIRMKPEAAALYQHRRDVLLGAGRPSQQCLPHSIPDAMLPGPDGILPGVVFKILQNQDITVILFEEFNHYRQIFTDGRPLPEISQPAWFGYSIGRWDGDRFVVTTTGFNDRSWLDDTGHPHSEAMKTTERFRRLDFGHMEMQVTIEDAQTYFEPFTVTVPFVLQADSELIEDICENNRDLAEIPAK